MKNYIKKEEGCSSTCYYNEKEDYHRLDGPAYEGKNGFKAWWVNGKRHRLDGPAVIDPSVKQHNQYWINGKQISSKKEFNRLVKLLGFL